MNRRKITKQQKYPSQQKPGKKKTGISSFSYPAYCAIFFVFAFALYLNTLNHGYAFDDAVVITKNEFTQKGLDGVGDLLTKDLFTGIYGQSLEIGGGRWRPLPLFTHALEYELFGQNPTISHWVNVLLYAIAAVMLFMVLLKMFPLQPLVAVIVSFIFIAHPVHTEVVANIKSRDEIFSFLFICLSLFFLLKFSSNNKKRNLVWSCAAYILSLLSKENGITFIAVVPLVLYCFAGKNFRQSLLLALPFTGIMLAYLAVRAQFVGFVGDRVSADIMENPFYGVAFTDKLATIFLTLGKYLFVLFFPHPLSSDYSREEIPIVSWGDWRAIVSLMSYLGLSIFAWKKIGSKNVVAFGIIFYLITLSIVSNIVFNIGAPMGERFLFLPSLGFCIAFAVLFLKIFKISTLSEVKYTPALFIPLACILTLLSYKTVARNRDWRNNLTLFSKDVQSAPGSAKVHHYYGNTLLAPFIGKPDSKNKQDTLRLAIAEEKIAVKINPAFHLAFYNLGLCYQELNVADSAIYFFQKVLQLQPSHILTQGALGATYGKMKGDFDKAIFYLGKAVEYNPEDAGSWMNLGNSYGMKGMYREAINAFKKVQQLNPEKESECNLNIGITYGRAQNYKEALKYFMLALKAEPHNAGLLLNIAETYKAMGDKVNADRYFQQAYAINPASHR